MDIESKPPPQGGPARPARMGWKALGLHAAVLACVAVAAFYGGRLDPSRVACFAGGAPGAGGAAGELVAKEVAAAMADPDVRLRLERIAEDMAAAPGFQAHMERGVAGMQAAMLGADFQERANDLASRISDALRRAGPGGPQGGSGVASYLRRFAAAPGALPARSRGAAAATAPRGGPAATAAAATTGGSAPASGNGDTTASAVDGPGASDATTSPPGAGADGATSGGGVVAAGGGAAADASGPGEDAAAASAGPTMSWAGPESMAGVTAPLGFWDPIGYTKQGAYPNYASEGRVRFLREAELKNGRVAMLAALGFVVAEQYPVFFHGSFNGPSIKTWTEIGLQGNFWPGVILCLAIPELLSLSNFNDPLRTKEVNSVLWRTHRTEQEPGSYLNFDPLGLKPKDPAKLKVMQDKEINNGRLAMIGIAGMVAQELVNGQKIVDTLQQKAR